MLNSATKRSSLSIPIVHFDVREMAYDMLPNAPDFKLSTICNTCGIAGNGNFHNSMYDVEMMLTFFKKYYNYYIEYEDKEYTKNKVKVFAINPWSIGKNKRLYVPTSCGCFYYDMIKKNWGEKDGLIDEVNMILVEEQAIKMASAKGYNSLSNVKESVSYHDM
jgi:hypothetical protein